MVFEFKMPKLGHLMEGGTVITWLIKERDRVEKQEIIIEIETEKSVLEVESPVDGVVKEIKVSEGETVPVGTTLALLEVV